LKLIFGLTLYELVIGLLSLEADPNIRIRLRSGAKPIFPPSIDSVLQDLMCGCLMYDPKKRLIPEEILSHPFITGKSLECPLTTSVEYIEGEKVDTVISEVLDSISGMKQLVGDGSIKLMEEHMLQKIELDEDELEKSSQTKMIKHDFGLFIEYVNQTEDYKLKLEVEEILDPYECNFDKVLNCGSFGDVHLCTNKVNNK
jgi:serine/threonine protein kinase